MLFFMRLDEGIIMNIYNIKSKKSIIQIKELVLINKTIKHLNLLEALIVIMSLYNEVLFDIFCHFT